MKRIFFFLCVLAFGAAAHADAQVLYGSIVGNVTDASSAAVPAAQIKIVNAGTGQQWEVTTGSEGTYASPTLPPGVYTVSISATGFKSSSRRDVSVAANSTVRVNFELEVGQVTESIEISAQAAVLKTDTVDVRSEVAASDLQNVPVPVTRNYQTLLVAVPGMAPPRDAHSISANPSRSLQLNANGTTAQSTAIRIDGATAWNSWLPHVGGYVPALEAIQRALAFVKQPQQEFDRNLVLAADAPIVRIDEDVRIDEFNAHEGPPHSTWSGRKCRDRGHS